jgi:hypothetical protein
MNQSQRMLPGNSYGSALKPIYDLGLRIPKPLATAWLKNDF